MKKGLKKLLSTSAVLAGLVALTACAQAPASEGNAQGEGESEELKTITVTHEYGETPVKEEPKNVVVFDFGILDALDYMGVEVTGLPRSGSLPAHLSKFESDEYANAGSLKEPDLEAVYEMNPDLIIISGRQADYYEELNEYPPDSKQAQLYRNAKNSLAVIGGYNTQAQTGKVLLEMAASEREKEITFLSNTFGSL